MKHEIEVRNEGVNYLMLICACGIAVSATNKGYVERTMNAHLEDANGK